MRVLRNIGWTVISRLGVQGLAVLSNVLLARLLGRDGFGEYALITSVLWIGNAFTNFGMDMILIRKLASMPDENTLTDGLVLQVLLSFAWIAGIFLWDVFFTLPFSLKVYIFALLPLSFYSILTIYLRARQEMKNFSVLQFLMSLANLAVVGVAWNFKTGIAAFAALLLGVQVAFAMIALFFLRTAIKPGFFSFRRSLDLMKVCAEMAVIGTLRLVYEKTPLALLPSLTGFSTAGLFSASSRVVEAGRLGYFSAFTAIYPEMARDRHFGKQKKGLAVLIGSALMVSALLSLAADPFVRLLFGIDFVGSVPSLRILAWLLPPYVLAAYTSLGLVALGLEGLTLFALVPSLVVLVVLLVALTIPFGITGTAWAVLLSEILHAVLLWRQWRLHAFSELHR